MQQPAQASTAQAHAHLLQAPAAHSPLLEPPRSQDDTSSVQPVFRAAPYRAELQRRRQTSTSLRILLLEEGNVCRQGLGCVAACSLHKHLLTLTV